MDTSRVPPRIFDRGDLLGTGGFAKVYRVVERNTSAHYADKVINKDIFKKRPNSREKVDREIQLHRKMVHKNIVKFYEFFEDTNFVHLILEVAPLGSLLNVSRIRGTVTEPEVRYYFLQIVAGTNYIHGQKILHRDLKLGNMFLSEHMEVKIGDFGLSISFAENKTSLCGTPNYGINFNGVYVYILKLYFAFQSHQRSSPREVIVWPPRFGPLAASFMPSCAGSRPSTRTL